MSQQKTKQCVDNATKALRDHLSRLGEQAVARGEDSHQRVSYPLEKGKKLSVILWNEELRGASDDAFLRLAGATGYRPIEIITIGEQDERHTLHNVEIVRKRPGAGVFATLNAFAADADGYFLCFMHDQVAPLNPNWAEELLQHANRPAIGLVGSRVHSAKGRVLHAGYAIGRARVAAGYETGRLADVPGYFQQRMIIRNVAAVSCAYCALRKEVFDELGGLCDDYHSWLSDVDMCQRALAAGYRNLYTPYAPAEYAGASDALSPFWDEAPRNADAEIYGRRWPSPVYDPYYNRQFRISDASYRI